jgi:DNA replication protein DnaD
LQIKGDWKQITRRWWRRGIKTCEKTRKVEMERTANYETEKERKG